MNIPPKSEPLSCPKWNWQLTVGFAGIAFYGAVLKGLGWLLKRRMPSASLNERCVVFAIPTWGIASGLVLTAVGFNNLRMDRNWINDPNRGEYDHDRGPPIDSPIWKIGLAPLIPETYVCEKLGFRGYSLSYQTWIRKHGWLGRPAYPKWSRPTTLGVTGVGLYGAMLGGLRYLLKRRMPGASLIRRCALFALPVWGITGGLSLIVNGLISEHIASNWLNTREWDDRCCPEWNPYGDTENVLLAPFLPIEAAFEMLGISTYSASVQATLWLCHWGEYRGKPEEW